MATATKDVSDKPTSTGVTRPTDEKIKTQDIKNKLQLFGIYQGFAHGKFPSNKQIDVAINSAIASDILQKPSNDLSVEGKKLVKDLTDVLEKVKYLFLKKNDEESLQKFINLTIKTAQTAQPAGTVDAPTTKEQADKDGREVLDGLRTLGTLLITNGQFRKLLSDASVLLRDILADASANAANALRPDEDKLKQIDEPAKDNTWHEKPNVPSIGEIKSQAQNITGTVKKEAQATADDAQTQNNTDAAADVTIDNAKKRADANISDEDQEKAKKKAEEAKAKVEERKEATLEYLRKKVPKERRNQVIYRLKKLIVEIQGHEDYNRAIETLLSLAETYGKHAQDVTAQATDVTKKQADDSTLQTAIKHLTLLIEKFANSTSLDDLFDSIKQLYTDAEQDPELKKFWRDTTAYIRKSLKQQGFVLQDEANDEFNDLQKRGQFLLRDRYKEHTDRVLDEAKRFGDAFAQDPDSIQFGESVQNLLDDLGTDDSGKATFKPHLLKDVFNVILPGFIKHVRYVPLPRAEVSTPEIDGIFENIVIESENLFPNLIEIHNENFIRYSAYKNITNKGKHSFAVHLEQIQFDLKDVAYYIKRKQGFPAITDTGVVDILLSGKGLSIDLALSTAEKKDRTHFFKVEKVDVKIHNLKLKVKQSKHKLLIGTFKPLAIAALKPLVRAIVKKTVTEQFQNLDAEIYAISQDVKKSTKEAQIKAKDSDEPVPSIYQEWFNAVQKRITESKKKGEEKVPDAKVNIATTQKESLFKDIKLPGGISTQATEYLELAEKGTDWKSPVFDIGSAKASASLPTSPKPTRKSPHRQAATVNSTSSVTNGQTSSY